MDKREGGRRGKKKERREGGRREGRKGRREEEREGEREGEGWRGRGRKEREEGERDERERGRGREEGEEGAEGKREKGKEEQREEKDRGRRGTEREGGEEGRKERRGGRREERKKGETWGRREERKRNKEEGKPPAPLLQGTQLTRPSVAQDGVFHLRVENLETKEEGTQRQRINRGCSRRKDKGADTHGRHRCGLMPVGTTLSNVALVLKEASGKLEMTSLWVCLIRNHGVQHRYTR